MCLSMCVYVCVGVRACAHAVWVPCCSLSLQRTTTHRHTLQRIETYVQKDSWNRLPVYLYKCVHTERNRDIHMHTCTHIRNKTWTRTHTDAHTHTHIQTQIQLIPLGVTFSNAVSKLKAQSSNVSFATFQWKKPFELWALSFERAFENVISRGIGCVYMHLYKHMYIHMCIRVCTVKRSISSVGVSVQYV